MGLIRIEDPWYGYDERKKDDEEYRKMAEEFHKYLNEICEDGMVFLYDITDAWNRPLAKIKVFDDGTVIIIQDDEVIKHHLDENSIHEIVARVAEDKFYLDSIAPNFEKLAFLDGFQYNIILWDGRYHYYEGHSNIQAYTKKHPIGHRFVLLVDGVLDIIKTAGIPIESKYVYDWLKD